jgi:hypothetical protein
MTTILPGGELPPPRDPAPLIGGGVTIMSAEEAGHHPEVWIRFKASGTRAEALLALDPLAGRLEAEFPGCRVDQLTIRTPVRRGARSSVGVCLRHRNRAFPVPTPKQVASVVKNWHERRHGPNDPGLTFRIVAPA